MKFALVALLFASTCAVSASSSSNGGSDPPVCSTSDGFYCPLTTSCLPRSQRCTGDKSDPTCIQKTYRWCNYNPSSRKFKAYRYATALASFGSISSRLSNPLDCLRYNLEHHFVIYRGLMYEFGKYDDRAQARVQDPLGRNYEYNTRSFYGETFLAESSCTYEEVSKYLKTWTEYELCSHNCQDFARGLGRYLGDDCSTLRRIRRSGGDSEFEFAQYVFHIAGDGNCTSSLSQTSAGASSTLQGQTLLAISTLSIAIWVVMISI